MKTLVAVALGMLLAASALAQAPQKKNEVFVGIGSGPVSFMVEDFAELFGTVILLGGVTYDDAEHSPQFTAGYQHRFGRRFGAGVEASRASKSATMYVLHENMGKATTRLTTVVVEGRGHWLTRDWVDLYSGLGLGLAARTKLKEESNDQDTQIEAACHLTIIGVRVGRDWGGYLELGGVDNSLLALGLSTRF
jgi:hypothetical protein